ncbi:MAG: hypothetical protein AB7S26_28280 [Sandaracinaceae bacterium]
MGLLDDIALGGVGRLERSLGKPAALRAAMSLRSTLPEGAARTAAHLRAMQLAGELDDRVTFDELADEWPSCPGALHGAARRAVGELIRARATYAAGRVAEAELARCRGRHDEASAHYALGRAREAAGAHVEARDAYRSAIELAADQPTLVRAAQIRAVRALLALRDHDAAARLAAPLLPLSGGHPADRLAVAVAALAASGQYRRAAALDVLAELAQGGPDDVRRTARARALRHLEDGRDVLSPIEVDRVRTLVLASLPEDDDAPLALDDTPRLGPRARAVRDGGPPGPRPDAEEELTGWLALEVIHRTRTRERGRARHALDELRERVERAPRGEASVWTAARVGLAMHPEAARAIAMRLLRSPCPPPPRGYRAVAEALDAVGYTDDATSLLRAAVLRREAGATERLADQLRLLGWAAARDRRTDEAIGLLEEAKRLYGARRA